MRTASIDSWEVATHGRDAMAARNVARAIGAVKPPALPSPGTQCH